MTRPILLILACAALSACSGEAPFIETYPADIRKYSVVAVCHDQDATQEEIDRRAAEGCARIDKVPKRVGLERFQCRLMAPHRTHYRCVEPKK